jgi:hypothetical protein
MVYGVRAYVVSRLQAEKAQNRRFPEMCPHLDANAR